MATQLKQMRAVDWKAPLQTSHDRPRRAIIETPERTASGRYRVRVSLDEGGQMTEDKEPTGVYLYDESGICRVDGRPGSDFDLVNP